MSASTEAEDWAVDCLGRALEHLHEAHASLGILAALAGEDPDDRTSTTAELVAVLGQATGCVRTAQLSIDPAAPLPAAYREAP